ncbi:hypothetical protein DPMN_071483 [Dreissena polymorpha]|uniref:Uncharacterized protein n=1 Tax=Dreissena polymorpha TaxID=45954 RepID=A0A9D3Z7T9_DREPO|nr:hypothetical protein DPMN_071483 [Dreissena polymorpha]
MRRMLSIHFFQQDSNHDKCRLPVVSSRADEHFNPDSEPLDAYNHKTGGENGDPSN